MQTVVLEQLPVLAGEIWIGEITDERRVVIAQALT
jgi:hypothetical protein